MSLCFYTPRPVHPKLARGRVWCTECGRTRTIDPAECFAHGWPKCCGYTMAIDSPEEQRRTQERTP